MPSKKRDIHLLRIRRLQRLLPKESIDGLLITNLTNVKYLTGFHSSSAQLLVSDKGCILITDFRYIEAARESVRFAEVIQFGKKPRDDFRNLINKYGIKRIGFESSNVIFNRYRQLANWIGQKRMIPKADIVERLRMIKDDNEIEEIKKAIRLSEKGFRNIRDSLKPGISEKEIALKLELFFKMNGGDGCAFDIISAFGAHSSIPHHHTGITRLNRNDMVLIDFGAKYNGYCSDLTRTLLSNRITDKEKTIYSIVLEAQQKAIEKIRPGIPLADIDRTARDVIAKYGYGDAFGHSFGHGIGLDIHEMPAVSLKSKLKCKKGMIITAEPGIYIPGWGGVRIEDDILVIDKGYEILSRLGKKAESW